MRASLTTHGQARSGGSEAQASVRGSFGRLRLRWAKLGNKGVTAVAFGVVAMVSVGFVGLGTEGGSWYLTRRNTQNTADPAAYAGAVRLAFARGSLSLPLPGAQAQAVDTATEVAQRNGFTTGQNNTIVTVNTPPLSGAQAGNTTAVEVIVQRTPPRLISNLFLAADPVIRTRGVAALTNNGPACLVANPPAGGSVTGQLLFSGSTNVSAPSCILASNSALPDAISFGGNAATVNASSLTSVGGCSNCSGSNVTVAQPITPYAAPTANPLASRDAGLLQLVQAVPAFTSASCHNIPGVNPNNGNIASNTLTVSPPPTGKAICALKVSTGQTVTFQPGTYYFYSSSTNSSQSALSIQGGTVNFGTGTYYFYNSSLTIQGGTVTGTGTSFVFTGGSNQAGGPNINGNAVVNLTAPTTAQATNSNLAGMLFFRDPRATNGNTQGSPAVDINGGANTVLTGAMYFPNSYVKYSGNPGGSVCSVLVGGTIDLTGNSGLSVTQCASMFGGGLTPMLQVVRLME